MLNLLNATTADSATFWILVVLGVLLIVELAFFAILFAYNRAKQSEEVSRRIISITLNTANVKRKYKSGEEFDRSGLVVMAHYNLEPYAEQVTDYDLLPPDMRIGGNIAVTVTYRGQIAVFMIAVETEDDTAVPVQENVKSFETVKEPETVEKLETVEEPETIKESEAVEEFNTVEEPETVEYEITVIAPEELKSLQVALFNGQIQAGEAANVIDNKAIITAPVGEYIVKVFGLPDDDYEVSADLLSAENRAVTVTVDYCEDYYVNADRDEKEFVDYEINVVAPEELKSLQVALYNGGNQVGAANVVDGKAIISAPAGDYSVKVFGLPDDDYVPNSELLSATKLSATVTIDYCEDYYDSDDAEEEDEVSDLADSKEVDYIISIVAPEELKSLQVALYNGNEQIGSAVNVENCMATITAPAGDYYVKVFCLPDDDYVASVELLSAEKHEATVTITYCEDYEGYDESYDEEVITVADIVEDVEPELIEYNISVDGPENLPAIQVALYNGATQIGSAVNVNDGAATIKAEAGDYTVKVFGLSEEEYEVETDLLSEDKLNATVKITAIEEEIIEEYIPEPVEVVEVKPEIVEYKVLVEAPEGLPALQIALFNGDTQIGLAVNVENGTAVFNEEAGDYAIKVFGLPEGYEATAETLSETRTTATVTVTAPAVEVPQTPESDPLIIEEESFDGGILRYDRSFKARVIQSDNDIKNWYTELKNELLSYKKVKDRLSWKRESYNCGRNSVARLAFRGNTLCLYLPLNPAAYEDSKYKVESVEDNASYEDTPCLYRIKNDKRARYAKELIATVMDNLGIVRIERDSVDYYEPYEGLVQLINKGLIKRNIKDKATEAFFTEKKDNDTF